MLDEESFANGTSPNEEGISGFVDYHCNLEEDSAKNEVIFFDAVIEQIPIRLFLPEKPDQCSPRSETFFVQVVIFQFHPAVDIFFDDGS
jgi:hypothetical protein